MADQTKSAEPGLSTAPATAKETTTPPVIVAVQQPEVSSNSYREAMLWAQVTASDECSTSTFHLPELQSRPSTPPTDLRSLWLSNYLSQPDAPAEAPVIPAFMSPDLDSSFPDLGIWDHTTCILKTPAPAPTELPRWMPVQAPGAELSPCSPLAFGMQPDGSPGASNFNPSWPATTSRTPPPLWNSLPSSVTQFAVPERGRGVFQTSPPARRELFRPHSATASTHYSPYSHHSHHGHHGHHSGHLIHAANAFGRPGYKQVSAPVTFSSPNANAFVAVPGFVAASGPSWSQQMAPVGSWTMNYAWNNGQEMMVPRRGLYSESRPVLPAAGTMPAPVLTSFGNRVGSMPSWNPRAADPRGKLPLQTGETSAPSRKRTNLAVDPSGGAALLWNHGPSSATWGTGTTGTTVASREVWALGPALNTNGKPRARRGSATDPQSVYARYRREKITERVKTLQELIPNGTKVDIVTMLDEAHSYVKFLERQIELLKSDENWKFATPSIYKGMDLSQPQAPMLQMPRPEVFPW